MRERLRAQSRGMLGTPALGAAVACPACLLAPEAHSPRDDVASRWTVVPRVLDRAQRRGYYVLV